MATDITLDHALQTTRYALDGLSERQKMISQNLANVDTPGYQAQKLDFESALNAAKSKGNSLQLAATNERHIALKSPGLQMSYAMRTGGSERADGNNVDIDVELTEMSEAGIEYQALTQAASKKLALLKTIASSK
jgi:flagellar basal-body rod protein FlgB